MAEDFAVTEHAVDDERFIVAVRGAVTLFPSGALREALLRVIDDGHARLVVDLSDTSFVDSSGMAALLVAHRRMRGTPTAGWWSSAPTRT